VYSSSSISVNISSRGWLIILMRKRKIFTRRNRWFIRVKKRYGLNGSPDHIRTHFCSHRGHDRCKTLSTQFHRITKTHHRLFLLVSRFVLSSIRHEKDRTLILKKYKHLFFDLDGTLYGISDSTRVITLRTLVREKCNNELEWR
jgi:hypothetical protein